MTVSVKRGLYNFKNDAILLTNTKSNQQIIQLLLPKYVTVQKLYDKMLKNYNNDYKKLNNKC